MIRMFIDDERDPLDSDWVVIRSYEEFIDWMAGNLEGTVRQRFYPNFISFDHDLGGKFSGLDIVKSMIDMDMNQFYAFPEDFNWFTHSQNPVGKVNIDSLLVSYLNFRDFYRSK